MATSGRAAGERKNIFVFVKNVREIYATVIQQQMFLF